GVHAHRAMRSLDRWGLPRGHQGLDGFVVKLSNSLSGIFGRAIGYSLGDNCSNVAAGPSNRTTILCQVDGGPDGTLIVDDQGQPIPGPVDAKNADVLVINLDGAGNIVWETRYGGPASDYPGSLAVDESGNAIFDMQAPGSNQIVFRK